MYKKNLPDHYTANIINIYEFCLHILKEFNHVQIICDIQLSAFKGLSDTGFQNSVPILDHFYPRNFFNY